MKILPVAVELLHADRRTDMTKLIVAFCNFANAPKNTLFMFDTPRWPLHYHFLCHS